MSANDIGTSDSVIVDRSLVTLSGGTVGGENLNDPGTWTETTSDTPEPESLVLAGTGLMWLAAAVRRRFSRS
jgi:hypothetical protein